VNSEVKKLQRFNISLTVRKFGQFSSYRIAYGIRTYKRVTQILINLKKDDEMKIRKILMVVGLAGLCGAVSAQAIPPANLTHVTNITVQNVTAATACSATFMSGGTSYTASATYISGPTSGTASGGGGNYININCNGNQPVAFTANAGAGNNATASSRRAATSGATPTYINYQLTKFGPPTVVWDAATPNFGGTPITGTASPAFGFSYGVDIPAGQTNLAAGTYTDTVAITVTF
jgi:spore coat protein U-like protein